MIRLVTRAMAAKNLRHHAALGTAYDNVLSISIPSVPSFSSKALINEAEKAVALPSHVKFRMPDLDFKEVGSGAADATLTKWHVKEGAAVKDGTHMCEIDTPDLCFQLEAGDEGFIARLLVGEGANNIAPGRPLAIIVSTEAEVEQFVQFLQKNPRCIKGYLEPSDAAQGIEAKEAAVSTVDAVSSDVLRMLNKLQKEGLFEDGKALKLLKSLARKNNEHLLTTYKASYADGVLEEAAFDKAFFVQNALELAEEASGTTKEHSAS